MSARRGRRPASVSSSIEVMIRGRRTKTGVSERTLKGLHDNLFAIYRERAAAGDPLPLPWEVDAAYLRRLIWSWGERGLAVSTRHDYWFSVRCWIEFYGNTVCADIVLRLPPDMRPNVDWLSVEQARQLLALSMSPRTRLIVHCELCLGMRRIEVLRLTTASFTGSYVDILGKGRAGGKPRRMPYHRETARVVADYMEERARIVARHPEATGEPRLILGVKGGRARPLSEKGTVVDSILERLGRLILYPGHLSSHTLRRTFGRQMYRAGVPPATIAKMLGHESIDTTLRYLGVDMDDMTMAMGVFML